MSTKEIITCPNCGHVINRYKNPYPTVDIIIEYLSGVVLVYRKNPPHGWALPGGFVDYGESVEDAAVREAREETSLNVEDLQLFNVYSAPDRDPRFHTITTVFVARGAGDLLARDDAEDVRVFSLGDLPEPIVFDHGTILKEYQAWKKKQAGGC
jgi:8-oxo-dGTP diphosphatase